MENEWDELYYTEEEFHQLHELSSGFNDDINRNKRDRKDGESFGSFIDKGSTELIKSWPDTVARLH